MGTRFGARPFSGRRGCAEKSSGKTVCCLDPCFDCALSQCAEKILQHQRKKWHVKKRTILHINFYEKDISVIFEMKKEKYFLK